MVEKLKGWLVDKGLSDPAIAWSVTLVELAALIALAFLLHVLLQRFLLQYAKHIAKRTRTRTRTQWDAIIRHNVGSRIAHLIIALVFQRVAPHVIQETPALLAIILNVVTAYIVLAILLIIDGFLSAAVDMFRVKFPRSKLTIGPIAQGSKVLVWVIGIVVMIATLADQSPMVFFTGLGTMTAVVMLVFRDSILGFVAGLQISAMDLVRVGDWIEVPQYGADGDVIDIGLTTLKVQNWDKTISSVPTYSLVSDSFKNWRGMSDSGGRRIKRSINIDTTSVRFCDDATIEKFRKIQFLQDYIDAKLKELKEYNQEHGIDDSVLVNGRRMTNVGTFRAYLVAYLKEHPQIHGDMTFLVRQLQPGPTGLPIEVYVFSKDQVWANYESIQSDIFDHIVAVIPEFDLKIFQSPSGADIRVGLTTQSGSQDALESSKVS